MKIKINGEERVIEREMALKELLSELKMTQTDGVAVALNSRVTPRGELDSARVKEGDEVEIIRAVQGG